MAANNTAYQPAAGQVFLGSKVLFDQNIFAKPTVHAGGIMAGGNVPTIAANLGAGTVASITAQNGYDMAGNFVLTAGTASITGGTLATVTFGQPLDVAPVAVIVDAGANSGTFGLGVGAITLAKSGFSIQGAAPGSGVAYLVSYLVIRSPL